MDANKIYCHSSETMDEIYDESIGLAVTSPPYNAGIAYDSYDDNKSDKLYFMLLRNVFSEVFKKLEKGGRFCVNIANVGRNPCRISAPLVHEIATKVGFIPMAEIIWNKGASVGESCAWGSYLSACSPCFRDVHETILVFYKEQSFRNHMGVSTIDKNTFIESTKSVWNISTANAKQIGHPAPFPKTIPWRLIQLLSYKDDIVLDPFCGSGTTLVAAKESCRKYIGYDVSQKYCALAEESLSQGLLF